MATTEAAKSLRPAGREGFAVHLALGLWGLSSWILFNGLWGQLPLFVRTLPEGNRVGVVILTAEQLAYVFPLFFMLKKRCSSNSRRAQEADIWVLLLSGLAISLLLGRYWDYQAPLSGVQHSVGLMVLSFLTGAVCSSTGVVFTPYLANCPKTYTSAHTAGAGLSGLAVALLALAADSGSKAPRLSIDRYFGVLSGVFVCSIASFAFVSRAVHRASSRTGYEPLGPQVNKDTAGSDGAAAAGHEAGGYGAMGSTDARAQVLPPEDDEIDLEDDSHLPTHARRVRVISPAPTTPVRAPPVSNKASSASLLWEHWQVFALQFLLSALAYGVVPSLLPLACAGYPDSSRILMLATVGFMCADPVGKLATSFLSTGRVFLSGAFTVGLASLLLACAAQSAHPPFASQPWGGVVPVAANTLFSLAFSFTSVSVFFNRRKQDEAAAASGERMRGSSAEEQYLWFAWSAFIIQTGAVCGTMGMAAAAALGLM